jgi:protein-S-isoprenylcysteine O-methyltransferase Ste14
VTVLEALRARPRPRKLVSRRAVLFAPLFVLALAHALLDPARARFAVAAPAIAVMLLAYAFRVWCTGYRTWIRKGGTPRYLMSAGPYARIRHPLYLANGLAGAAALVAFERWAFLAVYVPAYAITTALVVAREEDALAERFGASHARYRAQVPAFFPLPGRSRPLEEREGAFERRPVVAQWEHLKLAGALLLGVGCLLWSG